MFILHICYFGCLYINFFKPITFFILELSSPSTKRKNLSAILNHKEVKRIIMHNYRDLEDDEPYYGVLAGIKISDPTYCILLCALQIIIIYYVFFFFFNFTFFIRKDKIISKKL